MKHLGEHLLYLIAFCLLPAVLAGGILSSCSTLPDCKDPKTALSADCTVIIAVIECAKASDPATLAEVEADIANKNWPDLELLAIKYGACVIAEAFSKHVTPTTLAAAKPGLPDELAVQYAVLRAKFWPGRSIKTSGGVL